MKPLCVAGIDTGIGKTYVTGVLARALRARGEEAITAKLAQTGCTGTSEDILLHRRIMGVDECPDDTAGETCPYVFPLPASPHLAADAAGEEIETVRIAACMDRLSRRYSRVLVEGVGGLCVPLTREILAIDFVAQQEWPVILVTSGRLGSINHTILSMEACAARGIDVAALVYNAWGGDDETITADSRALFAERWAGVPVIDVPRFDLDLPPDICVERLACRET